MPWTNTDKVNGPSGVTTSNTSGTSSSDSQYVITDRGYGKSFVKLLHVRRDGPLHSVKEYEVDTRLRLRSQKDYLVGDNQDIVATDTQKNTVYLLARKHGVDTPEAFALLLAGHFLQTYSHVDEVKIHVEEYPWERLQADGVPHNHAFVFSPTALRHCTVTQKRNDKPCIRSGLKGLRVLKTTQSAFRDFHRDDYRTLPDTDDRVFSTVVTAGWDYSTTSGVSFDGVWNTVKDSILEMFAGPPGPGLFSPSVQNTLYLSQKMILDKVPQIDRVEMEMPNKHYFNLNLAKYPAHLVRGDVNREVYEPVDKPSGIIHAVLERDQLGNARAKL